MGSSEGRQAVGAAYKCEPWCVPCRANAVAQHDDSIAKFEKTSVKIQRSRPQVHQCIVGLGYRQGRWDSSRHGLGNTEESASWQRECPSVDLTGSCSLLSLVVAEKAQSKAFDDMRMLSRNLIELTAVNNSLLERFA
jgi:hypothetical protein